MKMFSLVVGSVPEYLKMFEPLMIGMHFFLSFFLSCYWFGS